MFRIPWSTAFGSELPVSSNKEIRNLFPFLFFNIFKIYIQFLFTFFVTYSTGNEHDQTPKGYCLWVNLFQVPLGKHWFQIESVDSATGEILLKLKNLRPFDTKSQPIPKKSNSADYVDDFNLIKFLQEVQWSEVLNFGSHAALNASSWCILNLKNVRKIFHIIYENRTII